MNKRRKTNKKPAQKLNKKAARAQFTNRDEMPADRQPVMQKSQRGHMDANNQQHRSATDQKNTQQTFKDSNPHSPQKNSKYSWIYGRHAVLAGLGNNIRTCHRLLMVSSVYKSIKNDLIDISNNRPSFPDVEIVDREELDNLLPSSVVHQGVCAEFDPLPAIHVEDICRHCAELDHAVVVVLDQVTDPRNIGAVLRSASAFNVQAVIIQERHAPGPDHMGAVAKAASGALETVNLVRVTNIQRALKKLQQNNFWCVGFSGEAPESLAAANITGKTVVVFGSEGDGMRRLVEQSCDRLVKIPINSDMESLNLSNACAIALYELNRNG